MSEETPQTVTTETKPPAEPGAAGTQDARNDADDFDTLLSQYDDGKPGAAADPKPKPEQTTDGAVDDRIARLEQKIVERDSREAVDKVVSKLVSETGTTRRLALGFLEAIARERPEVAQAFADRHQAPKRWEKYEALIIKELDKETKLLKVDRAATEDREAVTAAVRGASTKAPEGKAPDYTGKSDAEFRDDVRKQFGFNPI